jgi:hypothetical protein
MGCKESTPPTHSLLLCPASSAHLFTRDLHRSTITSYFGSKTYATKLLSNDIETLLSKVGGVLSVMDVGSDLLLQIQPDCCAV